MIPRLLLLNVVLTMMVGSSGEEKDDPPRLGKPSYYWSRFRSGPSNFSHRKSHIGPIPHINDVMTEWSRWNRWDRCSRSCGGGVRSRTRTCITTYPRVMPGSGVRTSHDQCGGDSIQYEVCGTKGCPPGQASAVSFRAAQCRHYNGKKVFGRLVNNWVPYTQGGINPCALVCEGEGEGIVYTFGKVTDGTHCKTDNSHSGLCVNGRCLRLSCDGRLGGTVEEDMCRVCGGNNDTCIRHVGVFHTDIPSSDQPEGTDVIGQDKHGRFGYYEVAKLPHGATNVHVTDTSKNFLALKMGDKYMLNGDWLIDWPGTVDAGGASFTYARAEDDSETLTALGPVKHDLTLLVLLREHNPGIHYEYWTPNNDPIGTILNPALLTTITTTTTTSTTPTTPITEKKHHKSIPTPRPAIISSVNITTHRSRQGGSRKTTKSKNQISKNISTNRPKDSSIISKSRSEIDSTDSSRTYSKPIPIGHSSKRIQSLDEHESNSVYDFNKEDIMKSDKERNRVFKKYEDRDKVKHNTKIKKTKKGRRKHKSDRKHKRKKGRLPPSCAVCVRTRKAKEKFCKSDFVSRMEIMNSELVGSSRRHEVLVHQSYKNTVPLLHKEYLWVDNLCLCPQLRTGRTYIIMGVTEPGRGREVRLVLDESSYVRQFSPKNLARIVKIRHNEMRFCRPWRRDLRFQTSPADQGLPFRTTPDDFRRPFSHFNSNSFVSPVEIRHHNSLAKRTTSIM